MAKKTNPKQQTKATKPKKGVKPAETSAPEVTRVAATTPPAEPQPAAESAAPARTKKAAKEAKPKKLSALDAAAKVLAEASEAMTTKALIEAMAAKGYWTSPAGQTPAATLYSAILRELTTNGDQARFVKTERGKFALRAAGPGE
jgi:hypothetical protein